MLVPPLSRLDKFLILFGINASLILFLIGNVFLEVWNPAMYSKEDYYPITLFHFYLFFTSLLVMFSVAFIGKTRGRPINVPRLIVYVTLLKVGIVVGFVVLDAATSSYFNGYPMFSPGMFDFQFIFQYLEAYTKGEVPRVLLGGEFYDAYYPPGVPIIYFFLYAVNPFRSFVFYKIQMVLFESGACYLIYKISSIPRFGIQEKLRVRGVLYSFFSASIIAVIDFFGKYDSIIVFLSLLGIYYYFTGKNVASGVLLGFCTMAKLYPVIWILGLGLFHLKKREFRKMFEVAGAALVTGLAVLGFAWFFEGFRFIEVMFGFRFQLHDTFVMYTLNLWFFLYYTGIPFSNLIPYVLLFSSVIFFVLKRVDTITPGFFVKGLAMVLLFYPSVNSLYLQWVIPLICIDMCRSIKKVQVIAILELLAIYVEHSLNFYLAYNELPIPVLFSPSEFPPLHYVAWRVANLGIFWLILVMLIMPRWFEKWFPPEPWWNEKPGQDENLSRPGRPVPQSPSRH